MPSERGRGRGKDAFELLREERERDRLARQSLRYIPFKILPTAAKLKQRKVVPTKKTAYRATEETSARVSSNVDEERKKKEKKQTKKEN